MNRESFDAQVRELEGRWAGDTRWAGITRPYSAEEVVKLHGSTEEEQFYAEDAEEKGKVQAA